VSDPPSEAGAERSLVDQTSRFDEVFVTDAAVDFIDSPPCQLEGESSANV